MPDDQILECRHEVIPRMEMDSAAPSKRDSGWNQSDPRKSVSISSSQSRWNSKFPAPAESLVQARHDELTIIARLLVSVVDDDESVRESLPDLLWEFGFATRVFSSAEEFLASDAILETRCLILDIAMPGMCGPDLRRELKGRQVEIPTIFITAQRDTTTRSSLLEQGAVECLFKPFSDTALLAALNLALPGE